MTTIDVLIKALEQSDSSKRQARAERIMWVSQYDISGGVIIGAVEAMNLLREARECFVDGHFIATLMLATALIEHVISEELILNKKKIDTFFNNIKLAREAKLFPDQLLDQADKLREIRNPFAHLKRSDGEHNFGNRYLSQNRHPDLVAKDDAKAALIAMYGHFQHTLKSIG